MSFIIIGILVFVLSIIITTVFIKCIKICIDD